MLSLYLTPALTVYVIAVTLILGAVMGSFAACMAARLAVGEHFFFGRSHCDACGNTLGPRELVPVFSWLFQKGRCRRCGAKIPVRYPLTELLCALLFVGVVLRFDLTLQTVQYLILTVLLLAVALVDYDSGLIPNGLVLAIFMIWLIFLPFSADIPQAALRGVAGALCASVPLFLLSLVMDRVLGRESLGGGDLKLFFAVGFYFSPPEILFLLILSCVLGIAFALLTRKTTGDPQNPKALPFGPAIAAAAYLSLFAAPAAVTAYLAFF